jgi:DNA-directed RNA polymerase subunit M/transcription elongation factor TFIIS
MNQTEKCKEVPISGKISGQNDLTCNECDKTFKYASKLKQHQKSHKNTPMNATENNYEEVPLSGKKEMKCDECGKTSKYTSQLKKHQKVTNTKTMLSQVH